MSKLITKPDHSDVDRVVNAFNWLLKYSNKQFNHGKYGDHAGLE